MTVVGCAFSADNTVVPVAHKAIASKKRSDGFTAFSFFGGLLTDVIQHFVQLIETVVVYNKLTAVIALVVDTGFGASYF